jgi:hypothetical protein
VQTEAGTEADRQQLCSQWSPVRLVSCCCHTDVTSHAQHWLKQNSLTEFPLARSAFALTGIMEPSSDFPSVAEAESGRISPGVTDAAAAPSRLIDSAPLGDATAEADELNDITPQPQARDAELESTEETGSESAQESSRPSESAGDTERAIDDLQEWPHSSLNAMQQQRGEAQGEKDSAVLISGFSYREQEADDEDELQHTEPGSASPSQQRLLDSQQQEEEEEGMLAAFGLEMGSLPSEAAIAALQLLTADDDTAPPLPPPSALRPSAVVQSLSLSQLDELLDFRSSLRASRRPHLPGAAGRPSETGSSSRPNLAAALRSLEHVLAHPLPCPSVPSHRKGYQSATLSASQRSAGISSSSSSASRLPAYEQMALRSSSTSRLHSQLHAELADIQQAAAALASAYPLDAVNAGLLKADTVTRPHAAADGAMAGVSRLKTVRKERCDYISAEHSRGINRLTRRRQAEREETELQHLLQAVSHTAQT